MQKLSQENINIILKNGGQKGVYTCEPFLTTSLGEYHCMNWCFTPHIFYLDEEKILVEEIWMIDTYFDDWDSRNKRQLTDENFSDYVFIFNKDDVVKSTYYQIEKYNKEDYYTGVALNSGGYSCSDCVWLKKTAKPNIDLEIEVAKREVANAKGQLRWIERDLEELIEKRNKEHEKEVLT